MSELIDIKKKKFMLKLKKLEMYLNMTISGQPGAQ